MFVRLLAKNVLRPSAYRLIGAGVTRAVRVEERDWFTFEGIPAGVYRLMPLYIGGVEGPAEDVRVSLSDTSFVSIRLPRTGAVHLSIDQELCIPGARIHVVQEARRTAGGGRIGRELVSAPVPDDCRYHAEGLLPGAYTLRFSAPLGVRVLTRSFVVAAAVTTEVRVERPSATLVGRVLQEGQPLQGRVEVTVAAADSRPGSIGDSVQVSAMGDFELTTDTTGMRRVTVSVDGLDLPGSERLVTLVPGVNRLDWELPNGRLRVRLSNWDRSSPVTVEFRVPPKSPGARVGSSVTLSTSDPVPLVVDALELQTYKILARQPRSDGSTLVSKIVTLTLDSQRPEREVTLELRDYSMTISVTDPLGGVLTNATVTVGEGPPLRQIADGVFALTAEDGQPGSPVVISAPGFVPTCVAAPGEGEIGVQLATGRSMLITFTGLPTALRYPPGTLRWAGVPCRIPFKRFDFAVRAVGPNHSAFVVHMPPVAEVLAFWTAFDTEATAELVKLSDQLTVSLKRE